MRQTSYYRTGGWTSVLCLLAATFVVSLPRRIDAVELAADSVLKQAGVRRGLFVLVDQPPKLGLELARTEPILVHLLTSPGNVSDVRRQIASSGMHGQVTVAEYAQDDRLPLIDDTAGVIVANLDQDERLAQSELLRVLRPMGKVLLRAGGHWKTVQKPRPDDIDDWPQYFHDAAGSDLSGDLRAGPARGLQWEAGPHYRTKIGVRVVGSIWLGVDEQGLVARDAYSGLPLWRRTDIDIDNRYAFLVDSERVYYHPRSTSWDPPDAHMRVLDIHTGRDLAVLSEGVTLDAAGWIRGQHDWGSFRKDFPKDWKDRLRRAGQNAETLQARLADGVLVQVAGGEMVALDAKSGRRLWRVEAGGDLLWHHPLVADGRVYAVAGQQARSWSYTHWPMGAVRSIYAIDLKSGAKIWQWDWPVELGEGVAAYNMIVSEPWLVMAVRTRVAEKSAAALLLVDRASGKQPRLVTETTYGDKPVGGGHSHLRVLQAAGKLWINSAIGQHGGADPTDPSNQDAWLLSYNKLPRPVGCTVWRATPNWLFGSLSVYATDGSQVLHTNVTRTACDIGAFPAAGMSFITPNHCFCQPYLPGFNAFHPRSFTGVEQIERLQRGPAEPAQSDRSRGWRMYLADARRGSWSEDPVTDPLTLLWSRQPATNPDGMLADEWGGNWYTQGPVTGVSTAEGVAVAALTDRQQVVAFDAVSGRERWRTTVDGRIDSNPTLQGGLVYVGTRSGWVYALNRETGELAWRFFAAPRHERIVAFGQLESPWPLHGSVLVDDEAVWAIAGRHNDVDGGLWWWNLDPITGQARASGRLGVNHLRSTTDGAGATVTSGDTWPNGANTPAVSNGHLVLLAGVWLQKQDGKLVPWNGLRSSDEHQRWAVRFPLDILVPGNQGLLNQSEDLGGYKMSYFGLTQAPFFAYHGQDFVTVSGTTTIQHRGGDRDRHSTIRRFRKFESVHEEEVAGRNRLQPRGAEVLWESNCTEADKGGVKALAVAGDRVLVGFSVDNRDNWRDRNAMPYRLRVLDLATGKQRQEDLPLPGPPVQGGISAAAGRVYVVSTEGTVSCFGGLLESK